MLVSCCTYTLNDRGFSNFMDYGVFVKCSLYTVRCALLLLTVLMANKSVHAHEFTVTKPTVPFIFKVRGSAHHQSESASGLYLNGLGNIQTQLDAHRLDVRNESETATYRRQQGLFYNIYMFINVPDIVNHIIYIYCPSADPLS